MTDDVEDIENYRKRKNNYLYWEKPYPSSPTVHMKPVAPVGRILDAQGNTLSEVWAERQPFGYGIR